MKSNITFYHLCQLEPRLRHLETVAKSIKAGKKFCASEVWYGPGGIKSQMRQLVGYEGCYSKNEILCSDEAYDVAYQHLWSLLPNCRHRGNCAF
ncbi:MAG: hypothetical protein FWC50_03580 [Planctomycetaceae bacterium]|nr:hypothetical protein [Planctomycetaceae bacterium]